MAQWVADLVALTGLAWGEIMDLSPAQAREVESACLRRDARRALVGLHASALGSAVPWAKKSDTSFKDMQESLVRQANDYK